MLELITQKSNILFFVWSFSLFSLSTACDQGGKVYAQVTADETLSTKVKSEDNLKFTIEQGKRLGNNLFHSFKEFSVPSGGSATFQHDATIANIFSRITGNSVSQINGLIKTQGTANLFLLNPQGIIFGKDARLEVGGSFLATTAESIIFSDGIKFSATDQSSSPLLTINLPVGLQFGESSGEILNQASQFISPQGDPNTQIGLAVNAKQTIALLGGNLTFDNGFVSAPQGRIELASIAPFGQVEIINLTNGWQFKYDKVKAFADINLTNSSGIFTVGVTGGTINLQGKNISISGASQVANTSFMGLEKSGNITLNATDLIKVSGISFLQEGIFRTVPSGIFNVSNSQADAGAIIINTSRLILEEGVVISTASVGIFDFVTQTFMNTDADSGNIIINALESMQMNNAEVTTATSTNGKGGDLIISTPQLSILQNSQISASNNSNFGMLTTGDAGNLIFRVDNLILDGAETSIQAKSFSNTLGSSGIIDIQAKNISLNNGARILVNSEGLGKSGILSLKADNLYLDNQAGILASTLQSDGGEISIQLGKDLILRNNSIISAKAGGFGDGGNLEILADLILAIPQENSDIVADAFQGMGGNINITAEQIFGLEVTKNLSSISEINASSQFGADGIITINNPDVDVSAGLNQLSSQTKQNTEVAQNCAYFFIDDKLSARGLSFQKKINYFQPANITNTTSLNNNWLSLEQLDTKVAKITDNQLYSPSQPMREAKNWIKKPDGKIVLVAEPDSDYRSLQVKPCQ